MQVRHRCFPKNLRTPKATTQDTLFLASFQHFDCSQTAHFARQFPSAASWQSLAAAMRRVRQRYRDMRETLGALHAWFRFVF